MHPGFPWFCDLHVLYGAPIVHRVIHAAVSLANGLGGLVAQQFVHVAPIRLLSSLFKSYLVVAHV